MTVASAFAIERPSLSRGGCMTITDADFNEVLAKISPSLSAEVLLVSNHVLFLCLLVSSPQVLLFLCPGTQEMGATRGED